MIEVDGLYKKVGSFELGEVSFTSKDGEYLVILGPSGAGKTMLLECIAGLIDLDSGKVFIDGEDVTERSPEAREIGFVYQDFLLFPHLKVEENVEFGLRMRGLPKDEIRERVEYVLSLLGITHLRERYPSSLSGGEKQRVALARAIAIKPKILLLDEPLSSLDLKVRESLREELRKIHDKYVKNTIHVTHDQLEAYILADRVGIIKDGKLIEIGPPDKIFRSPSNEFTAEFLGFENLFKGFVKREEDGLFFIDVNGIEFITTKGGHGKVTIAFRPEDVTVMRKFAKTSARNVFSGKIVDTLDEGSLVKLKVDIGIPVTATVTKSSFFELGLKVGCEVNVSIKASAISVF
ncbi:MAG: ABC transporter ATP-binding protein [Candidatus Asgardarchaeia archaeon]